MFKTFLKLSVLAILLVIVYGFAGPMLMSSASDVLTLAGVFVYWAGTFGIIALLFWTLLDIPKVGKWFSDFRAKISRRK